jgi:hypothetical protein
VSLGPGVDPATLPYQWKGLLLQTLEFSAIENSFRVATDPVISRLLKQKPLWHDWQSSMQHFDMSRWNDGDDFLVNYVGHPLQGAVAAYIEIQNSPTQARLEWGDSGYWHSRFKSMLWATAYSTYTEISPFGEAGIGNEGGFTYGVKCHEHCTVDNYHPDDEYTNNTGWVDFIVTPVGGTLWVVAEDILDREVANRIRGGDRKRLWPKVVRGALTPSRSFANMLRWKVPWYRDWQEPWPQRPAARPKSQSPAFPRYSISPHFTGFSIATNTADCFNCRHMTTGAGVEFTARIYKWFGADADISYQPGASPLSSDRAGGNMLAAFFGVSATKETEKYALRLALRPGFVRFDRAWTSSPTSEILPSQIPGIADVPPSTGKTVVNPPPAIGAIHHFAWNLNLTGDYKLSQHVGLRVGIGEDLVRYRTNQVDPPGVGRPPYYSWLSKENFINRGNWSYQLGPAFYF